MTAIESWLAGTSRVRTPCWRRWSSVTMPLIQQLGGGHALVGRLGIVRLLLGGLHHVWVADGDDQRQAAPRQQRNVAHQPCQAHPMRQIGEDNHQRPLALLGRKIVQGAAIIRLHRLGFDGVEQFQHAVKLAAPLARAER